MVFIFDANGNLCNSIPENVYEGSNEANTIVVLAPWTAGTQVYMSYQLPNSLYSEPVLMTEFDTSPLPEDLKANAWSIDIDDVITQSSGRVNFQFFAVTAGKILPSASVVAGGSAIIEATVNATIFATKEQYGGQYVFEYNGEVWRLDGNAVNLSDYGITLTSGVPQSDSTLTVTYKAGSVKRQATAIVSVPINKGNEIILPETPSQTIYDQILAALATVKYDISNLESEVSTLQTEVSTLQTEVSTLQTEVSTLQTDVSTLQTDVSTLQTEVSTLQTDVTTLQTDVSTLQTDVSTLQTDVTTLQTDVSTLQSSVETLISQYTALETRLTTAEANITALQNKTNLIIETHTVTEFTADSSISPFDHYVDITLTRTVDANTYVILLNDSGISFATYGFSIISLTGQVARIGMIGTPATATLKFMFLEV